MIKNELSSDNIENLNHIHNLLENKNQRNKFRAILDHIFQKQT